MRRTGAAALCALSALFATTVPAADAVHGRALYLNTPGGISCANGGCHGTDPSANRNKVQRGANNPSVIQNAINRDTGGMGVYRGVLSATDVADIAAYIGNPAAGNAPIASLSPASLAFGSVATGATSSGQTVTVRNTGTATLGLSSIAFSGRFARSSGTCAAGGSVAAGASCTVVVVFQPTAAGTQSGTLTIAHNATGSPSTVALSGTGTGTPSASVSPASLAFGAVNVGAQSGVQTVTLSSTGSSPLAVRSISSSRADFVATGGTCTAGGSIAAGASCTVTVRFAPTAAGASSGTLSIAHDAAGSPSVVAMSGTGTALTPSAQVTPTSLSFSQQAGSASAPRAATLSNAGTAALHLSAVAFSGTGSGAFSAGAGSTCTPGATLAPGTNCVVNVIFTPPATGAFAAALAMTHDDAAHSPSTVTLSGTGTAVPRAQLSLDRVSLDFGTQPQGTTSTALAATVGNSGSAAATFSAIDLGGSQPGEFLADPGPADCVAGGALAPGATCTLTWRFRPTASSGTRRALLTLHSDAANDPATLALSGIAAPVAAPGVSFAPASVDFGSVAVGSSSAPASVRLGNPGTAALSIRSLSADPAVFALGDDCPASLAAGAFCTLQIGFAPSAEGPVTGTVTLVSDAAGSPDHLALQGLGVPPTAAALSLDPASSIDFGSAGVGERSAAQSATMANTGTAAAVIGQIGFSGANAGDFVLDAGSDCPIGGPLAAGARCTIAIVFVPGAAGARSAQLDVSTDGTDPAPLALSGTGVAPAGKPVLGVSPEYMTLSGATNEHLQPQALVLTNIGAGVLDIAGFTAPSNLEVSTQEAGATCPPPPFSLGPGQACTVLVVPLGDDAVNGEIAVNSNSDPAAPTVKVSGQPLENAGAGGCSIGRPDAPFDPVWLLMLGGSMAGLWLRRRPR